MEISQRDTQLEATIQSKMPTAKPSDFIKYGHSKGGQIYLHKPTGKRFVANGALPGRRVSPEQVAAAVSMFYGGLSVREIRRTFAHTYDSEPSTATIYEWVVDYTRMAQGILQPAKAQTGDTWVSDEQVQRIGGKKLWLWTVMDADTRYILATHISETRTTADAEALFRRANEAASRKPERVITDGLRAYQDGLERVYGADAKHILGSIKRVRQPNLRDFKERYANALRLCEVSRVSRQPS